MNIWKKVELFYFSGTGNTYIVAKKIKKTFEEKGYICTLEKMQGKVKVNTNKKCLIGLLFPVAVQSTFPNVWEFANKLPKSNGQDIFMIDTMEAFSGGIVGPMKKLLKAKGYNCIGAIEIKMATSMQTNPKRIEKGKSKNLKALEVAEGFVDDLIEGKTKWTRIPILSDKMRSISSGRAIWTNISQKIEINHDKCVKCRICEQHCPVGAIRLASDLMEINHNKCISCMRCVNYCPRDAFKIGGKKVTQKQVVPLKELE